MSFVRKIKRGNSVYYAEVENKRVNGKVVQRHIRYLSKDPNPPPKKAEINDVGFGYLATMLMQKALTANDVFEFLEDQGITVSKEELEKIGLFYDFGKKKILRLPLLSEDLKAETRCRRYGKPLNLCKLPA